MLQMEGLSYLVEGEPRRADPILARAVDLADRVGPLPAVALLFAERRLAAVNHGDGPVAKTLIDAALAIVSHGQFDGYWTSALVYACASRVSAYRGELIEAREYAARAARLRPLLTTPCRSCR